MFDIRGCEVKYNCSTAFACELNGLTRVPADPNTDGLVWSRREYWLALRNKEVILSKVTPAALVKWRSVADMLQLNPKVPPSVLGDGLGLNGMAMKQRFMELEDWGSRTKWGLDGAIAGYPTWLVR